MDVSNIDCLWPGRLSEIGERCVAMGLSNPLIVTDKGSRDLPFISQLLVYLADAGLYSGIFSDISPNPRDDEIDAGCGAAAQPDHACVGRRAGFRGLSLARPAVPVQGLVQPRSRLGAQPDPRRRCRADLGHQASA
ncbi:MAG: iron-containing alcohol dehydrogenase [Planktomarina temperata]|nr:iron-containing alcohol dehydrogenase [Planktomarina temperata]